jgi:hypothetical protein
MTWPRFLANWPTGNRVRRQKVEFTSRREAAPSSPGKYLVRFAGSKRGAILEWPGSEQDWEGVAHWWKVPAEQAGP